MASHIIELSRYYSLTKKACILFIDYYYRYPVSRSTYATICTLSLPLSIITYFNYKSILCSVFCSTLIYRKLFDKQPANCNRFDSIFNKY